MVIVRSGLSVGDAMPRRHLQEWIMASVVSIVSARIQPDEESAMIARFGAALRAGMPERRHTNLLRGDDHQWQVVTEWNNRGDLQRYLASVDEPFAEQLFRLAGATSSRVDVFETVLDSNTPFWP
jgi:heme-degrading monooxygenase HmoA